MKLKIGDKAPAFSLPDESDEKISLKDFKGKTVVLYFYPKDMTPGCTTEACDFRDSLAKFKKQGCVILGISRDSTERHMKFKEKYDLNFSLLSDEEGEVCKNYGVWQKKKLYGKEFLGIVRTTFVIEKGKISAIYEKVKVKGHIEEIMSFLKT